MTVTHDLLLYCEAMLGLERRARRPSAILYPPEGVRRVHPGNTPQPAQPAAHPAAEPVVAVRQAEVQLMLTCVVGYTAIKLRQMVEDGVFVDGQLRPRGHV